MSRASWSGGWGKAETPRLVGTSSLIIGQGSGLHLERGPSLRNLRLCPLGPFSEDPGETPTALSCWARGCFVPGMGRRVGPTWALNLLRHVSETGTSCPGRRHSPACLEGWQTPGLGCCQAWPAVLSPGGPTLGARGPGPQGQAYSTRPLHLLCSIGHRRGVCWPVLPQEQ